MSVDACLLALAARIVFNELFWQQVAFTNVAMQDLESNNLKTLRAGMFERFPNLRDLDLEVCPCQRAPSLLVCSGVV